MKTTLALLLITFSVAITAEAEAIFWTNTAGGQWSTASNWSPNYAPSTNDLAVITNAGIYTVSLNTSPTIAGLVLGGSAGTQSLATANRTLMLNGTGVISESGRMLLSGGSLSGTNLITIDGEMIWSSGSIDTNSVLILRRTASLTLTSPGNEAKHLHGNLTNDGIVTWKMYGLWGIGGTVHNLAAGLIDVQVENRPITKLGPQALILNDGIFRKSTGAGDVPCGVRLHNRGAVDVRSGSFTFSDGTVLEAGSQFTGGRTSLVEGEHVINGEIAAADLILTGGTVVGHARFSGLITWVSGAVSSNSSLTVLPGAHLLMSSGANLPRFVYGSLTNAGTVTFSTYGSLNIGGIFHNLPPALFSVETENRSILKHGSTALLINDGVIRRSAGNQYVGCEVPVLNKGTLSAISGTLDFKEAFSNPVGAIELEGGTLVFARPLWLAGGCLRGWGTLQADVTNAASVFPAATNGSLTIRGNYEQSLNGILDLEIGGGSPGTDQSRLSVTGNARLRGTARVHWKPGYAPPIGTGFAVLACKSRQGDFCCFDNFTLLGQGLRLLPIYGAATVTFIAVASPEPDTVPIRVTVDEGALVCWPIEFSGYRLYSCTSLSSPEWILMPNATNRFFEASPLPLNKFFRLSQ
jgi:hypothetical protein